MAAAGSFAAVSTIFGSPVIGAVLIIEATGLGGAMLPLVLLPGLLAAGDRVARLHRARRLLRASARARGRSARSRCRRSAAPAGATSAGRFCSPPRGDRRVRGHGARPLDEARGRRAARSVHGRRGARRGRPRDRVRGSDRRVHRTPCSSRARTAFGSLFGAAATLSLSTLALLLLFKGLAWSISLGSFRGGPTFPAIFLGVVAGADRGAPAGLRRDARPSPRSSAPRCVSILRLPLSSVMIALLLSINAGLAVAPLVIVAVVVAYLVSLALTAYVDSRIAAEPAVLSTPSR